MNIYTAIGKLFTGVDDRSTLVKKNIIVSFLIKGWSGLVVFLMVPMTLHCLGAYKNGIWLTISSLLIWIDNMDIGLGNGLRNKLASSIAKDNLVEARQAVSTTLAMLITIIVPICLFLCLLAYNVDIYAFLNVDSTVVPDLLNVIIVCLIFVCSSFIFKFIGNIYLGLQLPAINNMLQALGQTIALCLTAIVYLTQTHSLLHIAIANTIAPLIAYLLFYPYTFYVKYRELKPSFAFINKSMVKSLFSTGVIFFVTQIAGVILFMSSNILISQLFSPEYVTPYQITYRYFYIPLLCFTIICTPFWSATTDAYAKGDMAWIKQSSKKLNLTVFFIIDAIAIMIAISRPFYDVWIGKDTEIPISITIMMAIYMTITIVSLRYSLVLNGLGALRLQLITTSAAAIVFIPLSIWVSNITRTLEGFMSTMCIVNIPGLIINKIQYNRIIDNTAKGIWKK